MDLNTTTSATIGVAITPTDGLAVSPTRGLWVGAYGDIAVIFTGGSVAVVMKGAAGLLPISVKEVRATSTTATDIVALY